MKIGCVMPQTGPLEAFAEVDQFTMDGFLQAVSGGLQSGSRTFNVEIVAKDSQSNPNRAAKSAKELPATQGRAMVDSVPRCN